MVVATLTGTIVSPDLASMGIASMVSGGVADGGSAGFVTSVVMSRSCQCLVSGGGRRRGSRRERRWLKHPGTEVCLGYGW
ncbi:hypothetical protein U1Q18_035270 [Sarracenia purpurea var. burkii]